MMRAHDAGLLWLLLGVGIVAGLSGCTTVKITGTARSSVEQRLIVRSLERAVAEIDTASLAERRVGVRLYALTPDQSFAEDFVASRLALRGVRVVRYGEAADVMMRIFASALAVDTESTLVGLPAMQAPVLAFPIPEIALFKAERSRGHAEVQIYAYDDDGHFLHALPGAFGQSKYARYTFLIVISFSVGDLGKPGTSPGTPPPKPR
jgi:hypothetical protein